MQRFAQLESWIFILTGLTVWKNILFSVFHYIAKLFQQHITKKCHLSSNSLEFENLTLSAAGPNINVGSLFKNFLGILNHCTRFITLNIIKKYSIKTGNKKKISLQIILNGQAYLYPIKMHSDIQYYCMFSRWTCSPGIWN